MELNFLCITLAEGELLMKQTRYSNDSIKTEKINLINQNQNDNPRHTNKQ